MPDVIGYMRKWFQVQYGKYGHLNPLVSPHRYPYMFVPSQLAFLVECLDSTKLLTGAILEVGCAYGHTTVLLNTHLLTIGDKRKYYAIDTFSGFVKNDIEHEIKVRKNPLSARYFELQFAGNSQAKFDKTLVANGHQNVISVQADVNKYDFLEVSSISFCLLDVDFYQPVHESLPKLYDLLEEGGIIVVDDCDPLSREWDGAYQAYREFVDERDLPSDIRLGKLGIIRKSC